MITIQTYQAEHQQGIIDLVLSIQQIEFKVPITLEDQPDLLNIPEVYLQGRSKIWNITSATNYQTLLLI